MSQLECTSLRGNNEACGRRATRVMAIPPNGAVPCHFVAPYCDDHAEEVAEMGGLPVSGPALSEQAQKIEGIR